MDDEMCGTSAIGCDVTTAVQSARVMSLQIMDHPGKRSAEDADVDNASQPGHKSQRMAGELG